MTRILQHPAVYWPLFITLIMAFCWFMQSPYDPMNW